MYKVLNFEPYNLPKRRESEHKVILVDDAKSQQVRAADITLEELYDNHVKPGEMLYLVDNIAKKLAENVNQLAGNEVPSKARHYAIRKAHTQPVKIKHRAPGSHLSELKVIPLALSQPAIYVAHAFDRAYQFVEAGSPVEVRMAIKRGQSSRMSRITRGDDASWPWLHNHYPHLRPDFILKGMPETTVFLVDPVSNGKEVSWVMAKKEKKAGTMRQLSKRLFKVKEAVQKSIEKGHEEGLPKQMKAVLREQREEREAKLAEMDEAKDEEADGATEVRRG